VKGICCVLLSVWIEFSSSRVVVDELTVETSLWGVRLGLGDEGGRGNVVVGRLLATSE
jgi:hypothetical protein